MNVAPSSYLRTRKRLLAAAASLAIAGAIGFGAVATGTAPVLADAVRVEAPQVPSFADVVERVSPAVVSVRVKAKIQSTADDGSGQMDDEDGLGNLPDNPQLRRFFREFRGFGDQGGDQGPNGMRRFGHRDRNNDQPRPVAQGSGFFISDDGYLVTNNHVVEEGTAFTVVTNDGKELDAKLIGTDPRTDLAVLKVDDGNKFTYVDFADDSKVRVGDWVV
ncbi:MAG: serine protease, partial [Mesorhizobium sp.]